VESCELGQGGGEVCRGMINPLLAAKLVFVLGWTNLVGLAMVFLTCRCFIRPKLFAKLVNYNWYKKLYQTHCWWWYLFFGSVAAHALLALGVYGNPF